MQGHKDSVPHRKRRSVYHGERGARGISDYATFAYLADVFVLEEYRGRWPGVWLTEVVASHPELQGLRRWMLATRDAHELYRRVGFRELRDPSMFMERHEPGIYEAGGAELSSPVVSVPSNASGRAAPPGP